MNTIWILLIGAWVQTGETLQPKMHVTVVDGLSEIVTVSTMVPVRKEYWENRGYHVQLFEAVKVEKPTEKTFDKIADEAAEETNKKYGLKVPTKTLEYIKALEEIKTICK